MSLANARMESLRDKTEAEPVVEKKESKKVEKPAEKGRAVKSKKK